MLNQVHPPRPVCVGPVHNPCRVAHLMAVLRHGWNTPQHLSRDMAMVEVGFTKRQVLNPYKYLAPPLLCRSPCVNGSYRLAVSPTFSVPPWSNPIGATQLRQPAMVAACICSASQSPNSDCRQDSIQAHACVCVCFFVCVRVCVRRRYWTTTEPRISSDSCRTWTPN